MRTRVTLCESGMIARQNGFTIALDPSQAIDCDFTFVSHAHVDHLHRRGKKKIKTQVLASKETAMIAHARGYEIADPVEEQEGFQLVDSGHILGSRGLLVGDDIYYTGDISVRERAFMKAASIPHAHTLIIESTFGRPEYEFPPLKEIMYRTNKIISEMYDLGIPVILMGYSLGKAQLLTKLFSHWDPIMHESVAKINSVYSELGVEIGGAMTYKQAEEKGLLSKNRPWVMVAPLMSERSIFVKEMKDRFNAVTIGFSGWAVRSRYRFMMGLDYVVPLSDHCDYNELVSAVEQCNPDQVFTFHGFSKEFAKSLRELGFNAEPIGHQKTSDKILSLDAFQ